VFNNEPGLPGDCTTRQRPTIQAQPNSAQGRLNVTVYDGAYQLHRYE